MKLELKHITPYLPYGVFIWDYNTKSKIKVLGVDNINEEIVLQIDVDNEDVDSDFKLILRPLSDLTLEDAKKYNYPNEDHLQRSLESGHADYRVWIEFVKEHFDVFGLIEKGLAIDINEK